MKMKKELHSSFSGINNPVFKSIRISKKQLNSINNSGVFKMHANWRLEFAVDVQMNMI